MNISNRIFPTAALWLLVGALAAAAQQAESPALSETAELKPADLVSCPFTPAEIRAALDFDVERGEAAHITFPGGRDVACFYVVKNRSTILSVRQTWGVVPPPVEGAPAERNEHTKLRRIPNDQDDARWLLERESAEGNVDKVKFKYKRAGNKVETEISVYGGYFKPVDIQTKLLRLKRVP